MGKLDFVEQDKHLYKPKVEPELVMVPAMQYLMYDGAGTPEGNPKFQKAFSMLYGVAYTIKMLPKKGIVPPGYQDFKVPPPEGLWWMADDSEFSADRPQQWRWTLMLRMPEFVNRHLVEEAIEQLINKKQDHDYRKVHLERLDEGPAVQVMHIGPYEAEAPTLERLHALVNNLGYRATGKHHEIYFGDPRRTSPEKLKTVLRQPVAA